MQVMVFGSFDALHEGHRNFFAQAASHGPVTVVVARDESIRKLKHREPRLTHDERVKIISKERFIAKVLLGDATDFLKVIMQEKPDLLFLGYDQETFTEIQLKTVLLSKGLHPKIIRGIAYKPEVYKSSMQKK